MGRPRKKARRAPRPPAGSRRGYYIALALFIFSGVLVVVLGRRQSNPPPEEPATFDGERALALVKELTRGGQRFAGAPERERAITHLRDLLDEQVDQTALQRFQATEAKSGQVFELTNIIGRFNPEAKRRVILGSHFDTRLWAEEDEDEARRDEPIEGANDGTSGVAVLIELARVLKSRGLKNRGVDFVLFDGEELGRPGSDDYFQGSRFFARMLKSLYPTSRPEWALVVDMVGDCDQGFLAEASSLQHSPRLVVKIWEAARALGYSKQFPDRGAQKIEDDHSALQKVGIPAVLLIDSEYPHWHTHQDTVDKVCAESLERAGRVLYRVLTQREEGLPDGEGNEEDERRALEQEALRGEQEAL